MTIVEGIQGPDYLELAFVHLAHFSEFVMEFLDF